MGEERWLGGSGARGWCTVQLPVGYFSYWNKTSEYSFPEQRLCKCIMTFESMRLYVKHRSVSSAFMIAKQPPRNIAPSIADRPDNCPCNYALRNVCRSVPRYFERSSSSVSPWGSTSPRHNEIHRFRVVILRDGVSSTTTDTVYRRC